MKKIFLSASLLFLSALGPGCAAPYVVAPSPVAAAQKQLAEHPDDAKVLLKLSELYLAQRDYLRARQYLQVAERGFTQTKPEAVDALDKDAVFRLAITIAVRSQQYSEAIRRCTVRLEHTEDAEVRELLATLLEATGDEWGAERQLRLLVKQYAGEPNRLVDLARFYERSTIPARRRLSRELYQRYLEAAPKGDAAPQVRAALYLDEFEQRTQRD